MAVIERWPQNSGFLSTILNGDAVGTKVSGRYREGGPISVVAVKRGSTVTRFVHAASLVQDRSSVMSSKAKARNALTLKKKRELIDFANKNPRLGSRALVEKFGCGKTQVNRIIII